MAGQPVKEAETAWDTGTRGWVFGVIALVATIAALAVWMKLRA